MVVAFILLVALPILAASGVFHRKEGDVHVNVANMHFSSFIGLQLHVSSKFLKYVLCILDTCSIFSLLQLIPDLCIFTFL